MTKLWKGELDRQIEEFAVGNEHVIDLKLIKYDCIASKAHAKALKKLGILTDLEVKKLLEGLEEIIMLSKKGKFTIKPEQEDCHTAIENFLTQKFGETGKKIHTARSRNDQIIAALRLYEKEELQQLKKLTINLMKAISSFSNKNKNIPLPGYTHTRKAMPYTVGKWALAFHDALDDDLKLAAAAYSLIDQNPLGSAAGYGAPLEVDRNLTAQLLGFSKVQENTLYVQNSRGKFELAIISALNQIMLDLNKMANDIILFSTDEFGYFEIPPEIALGSSIMPHKKNPDVLELIRAKASIVKGCGDAIHSLILNLPSGYNGDFKLSKEPLINAFDATKASIAALTIAIQGLGVNAKKCTNSMTKELYSTGKAYELVKKGVPFREAYMQVAKNIEK